jgi:hypothetical protein
VKEISDRKWKTSMDVQVGKWKYQIKFSRPFGEEAQKFLLSKVLKVFL